MPRGKIFLVGKQAKTLIPMDERTYQTEDVLQQYLEDYPDLLPGDQITPEAPRRWLLVAREMAVPDPVSQLDRWSLDHLYLDQDAIPTFVECKRSSDTRARREVVAQMLDYAANGLTHWTVQSLRQSATQTALKRQRNIDDEVGALLAGQAEADIEVFWQKVEANLKAGKVRLVFVADQIPPELRRLVEFLNDRLTDVDVLAVEIKQFLHDGDHAVLVPRLVGMTERAREKEGTVPKPKTTREKMLTACAPTTRPLVEWVLSIAAARNYTIYWGTVGFSVRTPIAGTLTGFLYGYPPDRLEIYTGYMPLDPSVVRQLRQEWLQLGAFTRHGDHTLRTSLAEQQASKVKAALTTVMDRIDQVAQVGRNGQTEGIPSNGNNS